MRRVSIALMLWCVVLAAQDPAEGGVVFSGDMQGNFFALDAAGGKLLWRLQTGGGIWANPITYMSEGKQYVAIAAGSALIVFALDQTVCAASSGFPGCGCQLTVAGLWI